MKENRMGHSIFFGNQCLNVGHLDILWQSFEISADKLMKSQNDLPSTTTWLVFKTS
jgi:hypothetical protein